MPLPTRVAERGLTYAATIAALTEAAARISEFLGRTRLNGDPAQWRDAVAGQAPQLLALQQAAVEQTDPFLTAVLEAQGADPAADGAVNAEAFVDQTDGGGSWLRNLVFAPPAAYRAAIGAGAGDTLARARALYVANSVATSAMQDIPRAAVTTGMLARRQVKGYVRCLRGVSCARCVILAGRQYRVVAFDRHPRCDCYHVPVAEGGDGWETDPAAYFRRLTAAQQDAIFGEAAAEAIRLGADMNQVVNASKGVTTVSAYGREVLATLEGTTVRGIAGQRLAAEGVRKTRGRYRSAVTPRLMPDEIFQLAEEYGWSREETLRQLRRFAYIV
jgi:hypothetical protein